MQWILVLVMDEFEDDIADLDSVVEGAFCDILVLIAVHVWTDPPKIEVQMECDFICRQV